MPCFFCIAAIGIAATTIVPVLVDRTEQSLQTAARDLRRVKETGSIAMWTGTFQFTSSQEVERTAQTTVTIYKTSKRARIQCLTHDLPHSDVHELQDMVANLIGGTVLNRVDGDPALLAQPPAPSVGGSAVAAQANPISPVAPPNQPS